MYVLKSKRWEIYANYSIHDREKCLDDAKALDVSPRIEAVCVIRETFNAEDNTSREAVIYHSPTLKKPPPVAIVIRDSGNTVRPNSPASRITDTGRKTAKGEKPAVPKAKKRRGTGKNSQPGQPGRSPKESNLAEVLPRMAVVCVVSVVGALMVAYIVSMLLQYLPLLQAALGKAMTQTILVLAFILAFMVVFFALMRRFVPALIVGKGRAAPRTAAAPQAAVPIAPFVSQRPMAAGDEHEDVAGYQEDEAETPAVSGLDGDLDEDALPAKSKTDEAGGDLQMYRSSAPSSGGGDAGNSAGISADILQFIGVCLAPWPKRNARSMRSTASG